jgi:tetratricopeptide (TPR) repeat protein
MVDDNDKAGDAIPTIAFANQDQITVQIGGNASVGQQTTIGKAEAVYIAPSVEPPLSLWGETFRLRQQRLYGYDIDFIGRKQELADLRDFLAPKPQAGCDFAWWIWTAPGGQGKSRLAFELCEEAYNDGWRCGFLSSTECFHNWDVWVVAKKTLVIVDQIASRAKEVQRAICALSRNPANIRKSLRFLMLERPFGVGDAWIQEFVPARSAEQDLADFFEYAYKPSKEAYSDELSDFVHVLNPMNESDTWQIFTTILDKGGVPHPDRQSTLDLLQGIDQARRPLFVVFAAQAAATGGVEQLRQWDRSKLVRFVLQRDFDMWISTLGINRSEPMSPLQVQFEGHLDVIVYATIAGPQHSTGCDRLREYGVPAPSRLFPDWLRLLSGAANLESADIPSLKPDMLAELFVLERLSGNFGADANQDVPRNHTRRILSIAFAWFAFQTVGFIRRCYQDFPDHPALDDVADVEIPEKEPDLGEFIDFAAHSSPLLDILSKAKKWHVIDRLCSRVLYYADRFAEQTDINDMVDERRAIAHCNRAFARLRAGKEADASADLDAAIDLAKKGADSNYPLSRLLSTEICARAHVERAWIRGRNLSLNSGLADLARVATYDFVDTKIKAEAALVQGRLYRYHGDNTAAASAHQQIIENDDPEIAEQRKDAKKEARVVLWAEAHRLYSAGAYDEALPYFDRAIEFAADEPLMRIMIRVDRSASYLGKKDFSACIRDCSEVIDDPGVSNDQKEKALVNRAQAYRLVEQFDEALIDVLQVLKSARPPGRIWGGATMILAQIRRAQGDHQGVIEALSRISAQPETDPDLREIANQTLAILDGRPA